jgi:hypothetical protein
MILARGIHNKVGSDLLSQSKSVPFFFVPSFRVFMPWECALAILEWRLFLTPALSNRQRHNGSREIKSTKLHRKNLCFVPTFDT